MDRFDASSVLKTWNQRSVRSDQVTGGKYMSVKNLLDLPETSRAFVLETVSRLGWPGRVHVSLLV